MSIDRLKSQIPQDIEDEKAMQEIIDSKSNNKLFAERVFKGDIPDIKTPEQELEWQNIVNERELKIKKRVLGEEKVLEQDIEKMEKEKIELETELESIPGTLEVTPDEKKIEVIDNIKCELCGAKTKRHKKDCPTLK
jgi:hypothetical protein